MTVYLDASAVLRAVLEQPNQVQLADRSGVVLSSVLVRAECWRTLDRASLVSGAEFARMDRYRRSLRARLGAIETLPLTGEVLERAALPLPLSLGTLDAIHLVTALILREARREEVLLATHDRQLAAAARLYGFEVAGVEF